MAGSETNGKKDRIGAWELFTKAEISSTKTILRDSR